MDPREIAQRIVKNVEGVIIGKREQVELAVMTLMCGGHLLIEDVPGVGKTMLARSLAKSSGCSFNRIQFTPDLLPSDVTGVSVYNQSTTDFEFRPGPVLSQIVLADEINRATPKAQSALLEAMEERQVTVDGVSHQTPDPFMVMATQNPIEYEGTFPLPEAQLDRFLIRLEIGYPSPEDERSMMERQSHGHPEIGAAWAKCAVRATCWRLVQAAVRRDLRRCADPASTSSSWSTLRDTTRASTWAARRARRWRCSGWGKLGPSWTGETTCSPTTSSGWHTQRWRTA